MKLSLVDSVEHLSAQKDEWRALLDRSQDSQPTLTPEWQLAWWKVFGSVEGRALRVGVLRRQGRMVAMLPLVVRRTWHRPGLPFKTLELLGSGERENEEVFSEYIGPIIERGAEQEACRAFAAALAGGGFGEWDELVMPRMNGESPVPDLFETEMRRFDQRTRLVTRAWCPYIPLPKSYDEYVKALPSRRRRVLRQSVASLKKWAGGELLMRRVDGPEQLEEGQRALVGLHRQRWEDAGGVFDSVRFRAFHDLVMPELLAQGKLELLWLEAHGEPVAAIYGIVHDGRFQFYQSGRRVDLPKKARAGIALHAKAIERAIAIGCKEYDFLAGNSRYKHDLALAKRPLVELRVARPTVVEYARVLTRFGERHARSMLARAAPAG